MVEATTDSGLIEEIRRFGKARRRGRVALLVIGILMFFCGWGAQIYSECKWNAIIERAKTRRALLGVDAAAFGYRLGQKVGYLQAGLLLGGGLMVTEGLLALSLVRRQERLESLLLKYADAGHQR